MREDQPRLDDHAVEADRHTPRLSALFIRLPDTRHARAERAYSRVKAAGDHGNTGGESGCVGGARRHRPNDLRWRTEARQLFERYTDRLRCPSVPALVADVEEVIAIRLSQIACELA